jgi:hypothetical protein
VFLLLTAAPIIGYFILNFDNFAVRAGQVSIIGSDNWVRHFFGRLFRLLLMFNIQGDWNLRHNLSGSPMLDVVTGVFFLFGIVSAFRDFLWRREFLAWGTVFLWFGALLMPAALTLDGVPHSLRAIGVIPPTFIFAGAGAVWVWYALRRVFAPTYMRIILFAVITLTAAFNVYKYFIAWANSPGLEEAFNQDLILIADYLNRHPDETYFVIVNELDYASVGLPMRSATIRFLAREVPSVTYLMPENIDSIRPEVGQTTIVSTVPPGSELKNTLYTLFPDIEESNQDGLTLYRL